MKILLQTTIAQYVFMTCTRSRLNIECGSLSISNNKFVSFLFFVPTHSIFFFFWWGGVFFCFLFFVFLSKCYYSFNHYSIVRFLSFFFFSFIFNFFVNLQLSSFIVYFNIGNALKFILYLFL